MGQRWCVVDAIADKGDLAIALLQFLERCNFSIWQHPGHNVVDPDLAGNRVCRGLLVASDHGDVQPFGMGRRDRGRSRSFNRIGDCNYRS